MLKSKKAKLIALALVILIIVIGVNAKKNTNNSGGSAYTLEQFQQIKTGMTYQECKELLGEGELLSETDLGGISGKVYMWQNKMGANMNVTFQDNKVVMKAQAGLK